MTTELEAFRAVDFDWTRQLQSVWHDPPYHVDELHRAESDDVMADFERLARPGVTSRDGRVIVGPAGSGKTHLIGTLRRRVWEAGGWFVLLDIIGITDFWRTAALCFINSLHQVMPNGEPQYINVFLGVLRGLPQSAVKAAIKEAGGFQRGDKVQMADRFISLLRAAHPASTMQHRDVVRAFLLLRDESSLNSAYSWLQGLDIGDEERARLRFAGPPPAPAELVRGMSWFMSLAGPTMIAADQLDAIVTAANLGAGATDDSTDETEMKARAIIMTLAGGLMDLKDVTTRAMTVVTCLVETWSILETRSLQSVPDRFVLPPVGLEAPTDGDIVRRIVRERLLEAYERVGFQPPYPTWPFHPLALEAAVGMSPRLLLMRCDAHRRRCIADRQVVECMSLSEGAAAGPAAPSQTLDTVFDKLRRQARPEALARDDDDSAALRSLLADALELYVRETPVPEDVDLVVRRDPDERRPTLHGRLVFVFHAENDREQHYCFRVIRRANPIAFQARLRAAMTASGIDAKLPFRHLFIVRDGSTPTGRVTKWLVSDFEAAGGRFVSPSEDDLRTFLALREMQRDDMAGLDDWLQERRPLSGTAFFAAVGLATPPIPGGGSGGATPRGGSGAEGTAGGAGGGGPGTEVVRPDPLGGAAGGSAAPASGESRTGPSVPARAIPIGRRLEGGGIGPPEWLSADLLPRHTAIIAGSGSGKTVLLRRIVEEATLIGIPSIVLDTNNDLARLGDSWPERPAAFSDADAERARDYHARVDVVIWTPGVPRGRPLALSLLPDFSGLDDPHEREQATQMALATLVPFVGAAGAKGALKEGVLADALRRFARSGAQALTDLVALLDDLPEGISPIDNADKLARDMANRLKAAIATNPLLKAQGQALDPAIFFAGEGGKPRVSVINLSGLTADSARLSFVNQLQMTLFTWIKRHPSPTGRLYVLDEAQNFAPSGKSTAASESARALAAQARKYGLGIIFATQVPKGIDNKLVSNCTTHFYGRQSAPATIEAAKEMMAAKGGGGQDIGRLSGGEFYFASEGLARPIKVKTPLCLSYHPQNPLSPEEVEDRAR